MILDFQKPISVKELSNRLTKVVKEHFYQYGYNTVTVSGVIKHDKNSKELKIKTSARFGSYLSFAIVDKDEAESPTPKYVVNVWQGCAREIDGLQYGVEVEIVGHLTISTKNSNYYLSATQISVTDENAIKHIIAKRKLDFDAKGYFEKSRNRYKLQRNPRRIGIVTSKDGSVIHDMEATINSRYPICDIILCSCAVQGDDKAAQTIADSIAKLDSMGLDAIIVARGGGSAQDLMVFNSEIVVKAMHNAKTYIVSAIGHQDDEPLCDLAANWRSATPTASINDVIPHSRDYIMARLAELTEYKDNIINTIKRKQSELCIDCNINGYLKFLEAQIPTIDDKTMLDMIDKIRNEINTAYENIKLCHSNRIERFTIEINRFDSTNIRDAFLLKIKDREQDVLHTNEVIKACSFQETMNRGFCLIVANDSTIITSKYEFDSSHKESYSIRFRDGEIKLSQ